MVIYAGVEGGGTSWRVALAEGHPTNIVDSKSFVTKYDAREQLKEIKDWLSEREYDALGIGTFGPIDPREGSKTYGFITSTPKPGWRMVDVVGYLSDGKVPCKFDTDVNAPALAECKWGAMKEGGLLLLHHRGDGRRVGVVVNGKAVHGLMHPELTPLPQALGWGQFHRGDPLFGESRWRDWWRHRRWRSARPARGATYRTSRTTTPCGTPSLTRSAVCAPASFW
ncbi:unnamed protein product [Ascophyllum nodosum]